MPRELTDEGIVMSHVGRPLYLCAGLQSSGSTLVSWCFLQRADMDGVLDARGDILPEIPNWIGAPRVWAKFTVSSFRLSEMIAHYADDGWKVRPLLVVRDVRNVFDSLIGKSYGRNGITAEEPSLRLRMRRFKDDWENFRAAGWPIIQYESLVTEPERALKTCCDQLRLPWDQAMLEWPKSFDDIAIPCHGNATFRHTRGQNYRDSIKPSLATLKTSHIPPADLAWLEREFAAFNSALGYPAHAPTDPAVEHACDRAVPSFTNTKRFEKLKKRHPVAWMTRAVPGLHRRWEAAYLNGMIK